MTDQELREMFERWATEERCYVVDRVGPDGHYSNMAIRVAWGAYQAAYRAGREDQREADAEIADYYATNSRAALSIAAAIREAKP